MKCPEKIVEMSIYSNTLNKIFSYARLVGEGECNGYMLGTGTRVMAAELNWGQNAKSASVSMAPEWDAYTVSELKKQYGDFQIVGVFHSHGGMNVFHSSPDNTTLKDMSVSTFNTIETKAGYSSYALSLVVNNKKEKKAFVDCRNSCGFEYNGTIRVNVIDGGEEYTDDQLLKDIKERMLDCPAEPPEIIEYDPVKPRVLDINGLDDIEAPPINQEEKPLELVKPVKAKAVVKSNKVITDPTKLSENFNLPLFVPEDHMEEYVQDCGDGYFIGVGMSHEEFIELMQKKGKGVIYLPKR